MLQLPQQIPAVWVYTTAADYNSIRPGGYASFLSKDQTARLERIRQARLLYDGKHRDYFLTEGRTQFNFKPATSGGGLWGNKVTIPYVMLNLCKLISHKSADLLLGEEPLLRVVKPIDPTDPANEAALRVQDDTQRGYLEELVERSGLRSLFYSAAVDCSYEGEVFLESVIIDGAVYLTSVPCEEIFPIGVAGPDRQYRRYERYTLKNKGTEQRPIFLLLKTIYLAGSVERHLYQLDDNGQLMPGELKLTEWPLEDGEPPLIPLVKTGIDRNTITYLPNLLSRGAAVSDYDGLVELQDELNAKQTQIALVLAQHSDPKMAVPTRMFDANGNLHSEYSVFPFDTKDELPQYITWNAELASAVADRDFTRQMMLVIAEMSPVLLGLQSERMNRAASFKAMRLESYNSLTKAQRKSMYLKDGMKRAIGVCQDLENTLPGVRYERLPLGVELRDGIPIDDIDQANRQSILRAANLLSVKRGVTEQLHDPAAVADELAELKAEEDAKTPLFFAPPSAGPKGLEGAGGNAGPQPDVQQAAEASQREVAA